MTTHKHENAIFRAVYHFSPLKNDDVNGLQAPEERSVTDAPERQGSAKQSVGLFPKRKKNLCVAADGDLFPQRIFDKRGYDACASCLRVSGLQAARVELEVLLSRSGRGGQKTAAGPGEDRKVGGRRRGMRVEKAYPCSGGS